MQSSRHTIIICGHHFNTISRISFHDWEMFFTVLLFSYICSSFSDIIGIPANPIFDGESLVLECRPKGGRYAYSNYRWYRNGRRKGSNQYNEYRECASSNYYKFCFSENKLYIKRVTFEDDNGVIWKCEVDGTNHYYVISVGTARVNKATVSTNSVINEATILTRSGVNVTFQCSTDKVLPQPRIWLCITRQQRNTCSQGKVDPSSNQWTITKTFMAEFPQSNFSVYCAATNSEILAMSKPITVKENEAPKLSTSLSQTSGRVFISCTVINRSRNVTFLPWIHSVGNEHVRDIIGTSSSENTSYIEILTNSSSDAGTYLCSARNGIRDTATQTYKQFASYTIMFDGVEFHDDTEENTSVNVREHVELNSNFSSDHFDVTWFHNDSQIIFTNHTSFSVEYSSVPNKYNASVRIATKKAVLKIKRINIKDAGFYYCSICSLNICVNSSVKNMFVDMTTTSSAVAVNMRGLSPTVTGWIVFLVLLLLAVSTLLVIVLYQRNTLLRDVSQRKTNQEPVLEILENSMYVSGDENPSNPDKDIKRNSEMEILENEFYVSGDESPSSTRNNVVNSSIKCNGDEAVYTPVNKTNESDTTMDTVYYNLSPDAVYTNVDSN